MSPVITYVLVTKGNLLPKETAQLESLTMGANGCMLSIFRKAAPNLRIYAAYCDGVPVGWTLLDQASGASTVHVYVRKAHRRKGVGRNLLNHYSNTAIHGRVHDGISKEFYQMVLPVN